MRVFVSYSESSTDLGHEIVAACSNAGIDATSYNIRVRSGGYDDEQMFIERELSKFDMVVVVWDEDYSKDAWLQKELFAIQSIERDRQRIFVIPFCRDKHPLHALLKNKQEILHYEDPAMGIRNLIERIPLENQVFVAMAFGDKNLNSTYQTAIKPAIEAMGLDPVRVDEIENSNSINEDIIRQINSSPIILCDLTESRPNVYFETGYALALNKQLIISWRNDTKPHFDLQGRRALVWETPMELKNKLEKRLGAILKKRRQ